ncbi:phospholipase-like protein [Tanacetum coccineum]
MIDFVLQKQVSVNDAHYDMPILYLVEGRHLLFGYPEFCLITGFRFRNISFRSYRPGHLKFHNRLFPKHVGSKITNLDLICLIEDEELFGKLGDEDAVRVCLLLALEVIFMGRLLVQEVDDTVTRLIENLEEWNAFPWGEHIWRHLYEQILNVVSNHRPTIAERRSDWYTVFLEFFIHYTPRTPLIRATATSICDDYLQKLFSARKRGKIERKDLPIVHRTGSSIIEISLIQDGVITELNACVFKPEAIIQVLARKRNGVVALNHEFLELFESTICLSGSASLDLRSDEDVAKEYIVQEELRLRIEEKERVRLKEQKIMEEDNRLRLEREKMLRLEKDKRLQNEKG